MKQFLRENGCWYVKYWGGGGYTRSGVPDLLICCDGVFIAAEIKAGRGRPSALQIREIHRILDAGGLAVLVYPADLELFKALIRAIRDGRDVRRIMAKLKERMKKYE